MDIRPNNLPVQLTSFIGREQEIAEVKRLLAGTRLLTLTGSGGTGKTRLSLQVAAELLDPPSGPGQAFKDGLWFIELAPLSDPALVPVTIAAVLGVRELPQQPVTDLLLDYLRHKQFLLIFDNCEHLIEACAKFADAVLHASRETKILATSREALGIAGETAYRVPSLNCPDSNQASHISIQQLKQYAAVQLFVERATQSRTTFTLTDANAQAVAQICYRLDGIPLAIELAAVRVKAVDVEKIAERLDDRFRLLTGGSRTALPRQQTLRATIDWSYGLLTEPERILLRRLAVFAGGWTLEAAEEVASSKEQGASDSTSNVLHLPLATSDLPHIDVLDLLSHLVDKSLVLPEDRAGGARYHMLETIRQYASEKLAQSGKELRIRARHLDFFMRLAETAEPQLNGPDQILWFDCLEAEHDNLRAATDWSLSSSSSIAGLRLTVALCYFRFTRGYHNEGLGLLAHFLTRPEALERTSLRASALNFLAGNPRGDYEKACSFAEESLAIGRELSDGEIVFQALHSLTELANRQRDFVAAHSWLEQMLPIARASGDMSQIRVAIMLRGDLAQQAGDYEQARSFYEESLALIRDLNDKSQLAYELKNLGHVALHQAQYDKAIARYQESLGLNLEVDDTRGVLSCLAGLASLAAAQAQSIRSVRLLGAVEALLAAIPTELLYLDQAEYERGIAAVRGQLDEAAFVSAWTEGRALTLQQAIAEAKCVVVSDTNAAPDLQAIQPAGLTAREVEVLRLLAQGLTDAQIAETLVISTRTVNSHLRSIYSKLDVTTRTAAARYAAEFKVQ